MTDLSQAHQALKQHFGYEAFRPGQEGVVEAILGRRDALAVMPTGAGKSVCYQVPGVVMFTLLKRVFVNRSEEPNWVTLFL